MVTEAVTSLLLGLSEICRIVEPIIVTSFKITLMVILCEDKIIRCFKEIPFVIGGGVLIQVRHGQVDGTC